jgi:hypothetical protein
MTANNPIGSSRRTVVGYFADEEDAHRAINDLLVEGFRPSEIGAAFHINNETQAANEIQLADNDVKTVDAEIRPATGPNASGAGSTTAGAASDSSAVTPAGLSTGGGTPMSGAARPGPIPGAEIPSGLPTTLPHTIQSTLPSTLHPNPAAPLPTQAVNYPATGDFQETNKNSESHRWEKLKHIFGGDKSSPIDSAPRGPVADRSSMNFGTGEGHLGTYPNYEYAYSSQAFESAFFGMGIPPAHSRHLSGMIRRGGAIVTVDGGGLNAEAEEILERNTGSVRYEIAMNAAPSSLAAEDAWEAANGEARVRLLGRVQRVYPGYVSSSGSATRKAS